MDNSWYSLDISLIWVIVSMFTGLALAFFLYSKKQIPWNRNVNIFLGFLRFTAITLIVVLLFDPTIELNINNTEKPVVALAIDDSESILLRSDSLQLATFDLKTNNIQNKLDYQLETYFLSENKSFNGFDQTSTNLSGLLKKIQNIHEFDNLAGIVLVSDGIHNSGSSPQYTNYPTPIFTIGMGDTIPPKDLSISKVTSNRVAFEGNQFPIQVQLTNNGYQGENAVLSLRKNGREVTSQTIKLSGSQNIITFIVDANEKGLNRYSLRASKLDGESSFDNNRQNVFIDVIESTVKVLIVAQSPHPDIAAIRTVLSSSKNYQVDLYIKGLSKKPEITDYNCIIYHNTLATDLNVNTLGSWYILGKRTPINQVNSKLSFLNITVKNRNDDKVRPSLNEDFALFDIEADMENIIDYPPINVPFGDYLTSGPTNTFLYQKVGSVTTDKPLMMFFDDGTEKQALTMSSGIWQWKLQEAAAFEESKFFDEMVLKTIQYLSLNEDKKRFIAQPRKKTFNVNETISIDTEVYNQIFERAYNQAIDINITSEDGERKSQQITNAPNNNTIRIGGLKEGIYTYRATVNIGGLEKFIESGQFLVEENKLESILLTADHNLLRNISRNSGGQYFHINDFDKVIAQLKEAQYQGIIKTKKSFLPLISTIWYLLIIMLLLTTEWVLRKYNGAV
jgi:hypothetical protein